MAIKKLNIKLSPLYIFFDQPAEEDRFSLYEHKAKLEIVDASTYVNLKIH